MKVFLFLTIAMMLYPICVQAELYSESVEYRHGDHVLEGYLAYSKAIHRPMPGVLVVHEWMGLGPYAKDRANKLAELGYIAFAVDMYGKGIRAKNAQEAAALAGIYKSDRQLMRERARAALDFLRRHELAISTHIAAIGYCFGGTTVLELARSGADIVGAVSFHGNLDTPNPADARNVRGKVLVLHGADDPLVPKDQILAFQDEMRKAGVDWQMVYYGGAVHGFTNPESGNDPSQGFAYNAAADRRSWEAMRMFLAETFKGTETR